MRARGERRLGYVKHKKDFKGRQLLLIFSREVCFVLIGSSARLVLFRLCRVTEEPAATGSPGFKMADSGVTRLKPWSSFAAV